MAYAYDKSWRQIDKVWPFISGILRPRPLAGAGFLAGESPDGLTRFRGTPVSATIRVLLRAGPGSPNDGMLLASTTSAPDGTWRVDNLDPALTVDVVFRYESYNDIVMARVRPKPY